MEILNIVIERRVHARNMDAKAINPQNTEINDWSKTVAAWCQRMSKSQLTLVEMVTKCRSKIRVVGHPPKSGV
jgi:hypothetical protein